MNNYVEEVNIQQAMRGAMRGLSDALDPDSAYPDAGAREGRGTERERRGLLTSASN